jgi:tryptophan halogenase
MSGVYNLLDHFPDKSFAQPGIDAYNAELSAEIERIRDFLILHYCATQRDDTPLWNYCRTMTLPDSLLQRIELYKETGRVRPKSGELFTDLSWFYIFEGLGVRPRSYDPLADAPNFAQVLDFMKTMRDQVAREVRGAPSHDSYFPANYRQ